MAKFIMTIIYSLWLIGMFPEYTIPFAMAESSEQTVTAAFLYNFLKYTEWPEGALANELTICDTDNSPLGHELDSISGRLAQNKNVRIKHLELGTSPRECQILFLSREEKPVRVREWLKVADNFALLTVGDQDGFLDAGGMILLVNDGERLQFEVNLDQVKRIKLNLSSQLLRIALSVRGK